MSKRNKILCTAILGLCIMSFQGTIYASASTTASQSEDNALGGWDEERGYFINLRMDTKEIEDMIMPYSEPIHTGRADEDSWGGSTYRRAHGWTTWVGEYHYTRARMELEGRVMTDSQHQWGYDGTEAISPWWQVRLDARGSARTYYGNEE